MSLQIVQRPTSPNAAYTRLLYAISGSPQLTQPQFQYVMDVYESGSTNLIKRTSQTANPAETAIFDPSRIIQGQLSDDYSWKISSLTPFDSSSKTFTIKFGVQYATSTSSSATVYPDLLEDNIEIFRGVVEPNDGYYNWPSSSKAVLSNMPATMSMQNDDYGTISVYNNSVQYISASFLSYNGFEVDRYSFSVSEDFTSIPISSSFTWNHAQVEVSSSIGKQNYRYEVSDKVHNEKVRFAFINKQGTWDYYNNFNPVRQTLDVSREQFTAPRVDYSSATSTYDINRRGRTDYHNNTDDSFTTQTDYLNQTDANWLEELIESPSVYIQRNNEFIPIVITDSSYTANTNENRQKLFQYTINFKPSNQPYGTWIPEYVNCPSTSSTFDPTLEGTLNNQLFAWWDFTNTGSMTMDGNQPIEVVSKGTFTGSLYHSASVDADTGSVEFISSGYTAISGGYGYTMWPDTYTTTFELFETGSSFTVITIQQAIEDKDVGQNIDIDFSRRPLHAADAGLWAGRIFQFENTGSLYTTSSVSRLLYISDAEPLPKYSSSLSRVSYASSSLGFPGEENFIYSYSGSNVTGPIWESRVVRWDYVNTSLQVGRDSTDIISSVSNLPIYTGTGAGSDNGLYARADQGGQLNLAHILFYTGSLSSLQIDQVINSFKSSNLNYASTVNSITN